MTTDLMESVGNGIATLTMNRPAARNALTPQMMMGLCEALPRLAADPTVRVVVLTGAGRAFCSGGDVKGFADRASSDAGENSFEHKVHDLRIRMDISRVLHEMPKPTLAVIPGPAAGAGLSLALACDQSRPGWQASAGGGVHAPLAGRRGPPRQRIIPFLDHRP